jgi:hypothetical protein
MKPKEITNATSIEEYVSLRQEVVENQNYVLTTAGLVLTATGVLLTVAFSSSNPILALFPLVILYLGQKIVFNNAQTEARVATYLQVFWETRSKDFHWERRQAAFRHIIEAENKRTGLFGKVKYWLSGSLLEEVWMASSVQWAFFWVGVFCIVAYAVIWQSPTWIGNSNSNPILAANPLAKDWIAYPLLSISVLYWIRILLRIRRQTQTFSGGGNLMEQTYTRWEDVQKAEPESIEHELKPEGKKDGASRH